MGLGWNECQLRIIVPTGGAKTELTQLGLKWVWLNWDEWVTSSKDVAIGKSLVEKERGLRGKQGREPENLVGLVRDD